MSVVVKGVTGVVEQPKRRRFMDGRCVSTVRSWRGPRTAIERWAAENAALLVDGYETADYGSSVTLSAEFQDKQAGLIGGESDG